MNWAIVIISIIIVALIIWYFATSGKSEKTVTSPSSGIVVPRNATLPQVATALGIPASNVTGRSDFTPTVMDPYSAYYTNYSDPNIPGVFDEKAEAVKVIRINTDLLTASTYTGEYGVDILGFSFQNNPDVTYLYVDEPVQFDAILTKLGVDHQLLDGVRVSGGLDFAGTLKSQMTRMGVTPTFAFDDNQNANIYGVDPNLIPTFKLFSFAKN